MGGPQRLGLPARAVEGDHQLAAGPLPQRVVDDEGLEEADELVVATDPQARRHPQLGGHQPELLEADGLGLDPLGVGELGEGGAPPLGQGGVEGGQRRVGVGLEQVLAGGEPALEAAGVDQVVGHLEHVARRPGHQVHPVAAELDEPAQAGDVALQGGDGRVRGLGPQDLDQPIGRHDLVAVREQDGKEPAGHASAQGERPVSFEDPHRSEDPEFHGVSLPAGPCKVLDKAPVGASQGCGRTLMVVRGPHDRRARRSP